MREKRHDRIEEIIHRLAAEFVREESTNASLITITRVEMNPSGKDAKIFFTTLPSAQEETAQKFLDRKTLEFKTFAKSKSRVGFLPHLSFHIDQGERHRQKLDEIS